jgi:hypothetical protein
MAKSKDDAVLQVFVNLQALCAALPDSTRFGQHRDRFTAQIDAGINALGYEAMEFKGVSKPVEAPDDLGVNEALGRLTECYSEDDPIRYKRQDTTPSLLWDLLGGERVAKNVRIVFYDNPERPDRRGTLLDMVRSREASKARGELE